MDFNKLLLLRNQNKFNWIIEVTLEDGSHSLLDFFPSRKDAEDKVNYLSYLYKDNKIVFEIREMFSFVKKEEIKEEFIKIEKEEEIIKDDYSIKEFEKFRDNLNFQIFSMNIDDVLKKYKILLNDFNSPKKEDRFKNSTDVKDLLKEFKTDSITNFFKDFLPGSSNFDKDEKDFLNEFDEPVVEYLDETKEMLEEINKNSSSEKNLENEFLNDLEKEEEILEKNKEKEEEILEKNVEKKE